MFMMFGGIYWCIINADNVSVVKGVPKVCLPTQDSAIAQ